MTDASDYVVVGSGAGGGTVAARLAEAGKNVVLLEAGIDPLDAGVARLPEDYQVPAFHPFASENPAISWDFFVNHYDDPAVARRDPKYHRQTRGGRDGEDGIFYPRASSLGGSTAHNAMIFMYPSAADWDAIAALTQDSSWSARKMRRFHARLEDCGHRRLWRWLRWLGLHSTGHGFGGWLKTERALPPAVFTDVNLMRVLLKSGLAEFRDDRFAEGRLEALFRAHLDPNDARFLGRGAEGLCYTPMSTQDHQRVGARERVRAIEKRHPERLRVELNALATRVLFDSSRRAIGVEYLKGAGLYRAHATPNTATGELATVHANCEVVLAGGAFNSPQLLMLSGIGDARELARHGIETRVDLPGVGRNLQDRYEVGVVNRMSFDSWGIMREAAFARADPLYRQWAERRRGMYISNGAALGVIRRSQPSRALPDLFCMALLTDFRGYFPGYSQAIAERQNYLTWAILKARTENRGGTVKLRSADPRATPVINFHYFEGPGADEDLRAVIDGVRLVRRMTRPLHDRGLIVEEELPGSDRTSDDDLGQFVRDHAWGHHASCSCAIGPREAQGVLNSRFEVHGTRGLRVVDASVFPRIPGFFVAAAVYVVGEKAADVILEDAKRA